MLLPPATEGPEASYKMVDFQNVDVGEPIADVAYMMILGMRPDDRRRSERRLVRLHYDLMVGTSLRRFIFR